MQATKDLYGDKLVALDIQPLDEEEAQRLNQEMERQDRTYPVQEIVIKPWHDQLPHYCRDGSAMFGLALRQCFSHQAGPSATIISQMDNRIRMKIDWWPTMNLRCLGGNHVHQHCRAMEEAIESLDDFEEWPDRGTDYFPDGPRSAF
jgi:hypothetical protein